MSLHKLDSLLPPAPARLHLIGIGGIGMSALGQLLTHLGYDVQGSDVKENDMTQMLKQSGTKIFIGHHKTNIQKDIGLVIKSSSIKEQNEEIVAAKSLELPISTRSRILAEIIQKFDIAINVAGSHGKTTTTAMLSTVFQEKYPYLTVINGGVMNAVGSNVLINQSTAMIIAEADESDGEFVLYTSNTAIITNIDEEHLDHYHTFDALVSSYAKFMQNLKANGIVFVCGDWPILKRMAKEFTDSRENESIIQHVITYGEEDHNDIQALNIEPHHDGYIFDVIIKTSNLHGIKNLSNVFLPSYSKHDVMNVLGVIGAALQHEIHPAKILQGLGKFSGVARRFTNIGTAHDITVIDDYAHHPVEIASTIEAARTYLTQRSKPSETDHMKMPKGRLIVVVQPHRYSRLKFLMNDFVKALSSPNIDFCVIMDVYPAGEEPLPEITSVNLAKKIQMKSEKLGRDPKKVVHLTRDSKLYDIIMDIAKAEDVILCLGAGDITEEARKLYEEIRSLQI